MLNQTAFLAHEQKNLANHHGIMLQSNILEGEPGGKIHHDIYGFLMEQTA
jgi:hypothetical protein